MSSSDNPLPKLLISLGLFAALVAAFVLTAEVRPTVDGATASRNTKGGMEFLTEDSISALDDMKPMKLYQEGKTAEAVDAAHALLKEGPDNTKNMICAGNVLTMNKPTVPEGLKILVQTVYSLPDSKWVGINYARRLAACERYEEATAQYMDLAQKNKSWLEPRLEMARIHLKNHEVEEALNVLEPARTLDASNNRLEKQWSLIEAANGNQPDNGWDGFKRAVDREMKVGYPGEVEAMLQRTSSDTDKALVDLRIMIARQPKDIALKLQEVQLMIAGKKLAEAKTALDALLTSNDKDPDVQLEVAELALWNHDAAAAKKAFDKAVDNVPKSSASDEPAEDASTAPAK